MRPTRGDSGAEHSPSETEGKTGGKEVGNPSETCAPEGVAGPQEVARNEASAEGRREAVAQGPPARKGSPGRARGAPP